MDVDILTENIMSMVKEHDHRLRDENNPDGNDINELVTALAMSVRVLVHIGMDDPSVITSVCMSYMRTAYGVGFNRGYGQEKGE